MAPRKARITASSSSSIEPEAQPRRSTRKRRLSNISEITEATNDSREASSIASPAARKRLRQDKTIPHSARIRGEPKTQQDASDGEQGNGGSARNENTTQPEGSVDRHVHFASNQVGDEEDELGAQVDKSARMTVKRRKTVSPRGTTQRLRLADMRVSLPSQLHIPEDSIGIATEPLRFTPLREIIDDRKRQKRGNMTSLDNTDDGSSASSVQDTSSYWIDMAKKEERIRNLMSRLASGDQDDHTAQLMSQELQQLQDSIAEVTAQRRLNEGLDSLLVVDNRENAHGATDRNDVTSQQYTHHNKGDANKDDTAQTALTMHWDVERMRLQDGVLALSQEVNDVRERWRIHEISLQSLGFSDEHAPADDIIAAVRGAFDDLRTGVSDILPTSAILHDSNADLLQLVATTLNSMSTKNASLSTQLEDRNRLVSELRLQINGLIERIADTENELERLRKQRTELLKYGDSNDSAIAHLKKEVLLLTEDNRSAEDELAATASQLMQTESEVDQLRQSATRYKNSLHDYRKEEERLQALITRMEAEHLAKIEKMNREREVTVQEMDDQIDAELSARTAAEIQLRSEQDEIARLNHEVDVVAKERDSVLEKLQTIDAELQAEQTRREQAEATIQMRGTEVDELDARVVALELQLDQVDGKATDLRKLSERERERRTLAEEKVAELDGVIEELQIRRDKTGIEINKLRLKLHTIQQDHQTNLQEQDQGNAEVRRHHEQNLVWEMSRRDAAEDGSEAKAEDIAQLTLSLEDYVEHVKNTVMEYESTIREDAASLLETKREAAALALQLNQAMEQQREQERTNAEEQSELQEALRTLRDTLTSHESRIVTLQQTARDANEELNDRDNEIDELKSTLSSHESQIADLESAKASLERRVEGEAEQMLQTQADRQDESDELRAALIDKQNKFLVVEAKARETDQRWQDLLNDREHELEQIRAIYEQQKQDSASLRQQLYQQQASFSAYVRKSQQRVREISGAATHAEQTIRGECSSLHTEAQDELAALQQLDGTASSLGVRQERRTPITGKIRGKIRRRNHDSGIGMASDELEPDPIAV